MYDINILPNKLRKSKKKIKIGNPTYAPFLLIGVIVIALGMNVQVNKSNAELDDQIASATEQVNKLTTQLQEINTLAQDSQNLRSNIQKINDLINSSLPWYTVLDEISSLTPPEVTVSSIEEADNKVIKLELKTNKLSSMVKMKEAFIADKKFENVQVSQFNYGSSNIISRPTEVTFSLLATYVGDNQQSNQNGVNAVESSTPSNGNGGTNNSTSGTPQAGQNNVKNTADTKTINQQNTTPNNNQGGVK